MRLGDSAEERQQADRLLDVATAMVEKHALGAPEIILNESVCRIAGYLYDSPLASKGVGYAAVMRNCGASGLLLPWRIHRAGSTAGHHDAGPVSGAGASVPTTGRRDGGRDSRQARRAGYEGERPAGAGAAPGAAPGAGRGGG